MNLTLILALVVYLSTFINDLRAQNNPSPQEWTNQISQTKYFDILASQYKCNNYDNIYKMNYQSCIVLYQNYLWDEGDKEGVKAYNNFISYFQHRDPANIFLWSVGNLSRSIDNYCSKSSGSTDILNTGAELYKALIQKKYQQHLKPSLKACDSLIRPFNGYVSDKIKNVIKQDFNAYKNQYPKLDGASNLLAKNQAFDKDDQFSNKLNGFDKKLSGFDEKLSNFGKKAKTKENSNKGNKFTNKKSIIASSETNLNLSSLSTEQMKNLILKKGGFGLIKYEGIDSWGSKRSQVEENWSGKSCSKIWKEAVTLVRSDAKKIQRNPQKYKSGQWEHTSTRVRYIKINTNRFNEKYKSSQSTKKTNGIEYEYRCSQVLMKDWWKCDDQGKISGSLSHLRDSTSSNFFEYDNWGMAGFNQGKVTLSIDENDKHLIDWNLRKRKYDEKGKYVKELKLKQQWTLCLHDG